MKPKIYVNSTRKSSYGGNFAYTFERLRVQQNTRQDLKPKKVL